MIQTRAGGTISFEYDEIGNSKKRTDYMGRVTNYTFDNLNRLTKTEYDHPNQTPKQQSTYGYDDISRLTSAVNEVGTVSFGYDSRNRLINTTDVFGQVIAYEYERTPTINQKRLKLDGALYATYNFDDDERLSNIVNAADSTTIGYTYFDDDAVQTRTYPNGVSTSYAYDNMRRLKRLTDTGPSGTLFDRQYGYNTANQISQITEPSQTRIFGYDNADRLTGVTGSVTESYLFDDVGNRTSSHRSSTYGYQPFNKIASTQTATYGSDANGNMTTKSEGSNFWRYTWDYENRMAEAATRKTKVRYRYDALGRRVARNLAGGRELTKFTYDGDDVLVDDNFGTLTKYLNGSGIDNKLRSTTGSTVSYFLADHLGSTNGVANSSGAVTASNSYDSFGNPTNTGFSSRYQFTGREFDSFTGLQFSRARFYDPNLGRFISEDPIGFRGGDINLYGYVWNDPTSFTDPMGLDGWGNDLADWLDDRFRTAHEAYGFDPPVAFNPLDPNRLTTAFDILHGTADMLRCGSGAGQAYFSADENIYGRLAFGTMDAARCSQLLATLAALLGPSGRVTTVQGEACPTSVNPSRGFNPFKGKTPPEIDAMLRSKGFDPRGLDPTNGRGGYVNPKSGRSYYNDPGGTYKKGVEPPHVDVNRPKGSGMKKRKFFL